MSSKYETMEDKEAREIAAQLIDRYPSYFASDIVLDRIYFMRTTGLNPKKWIARMRHVGHPLGGMPGMEKFIYLYESADERWSILSKQQQVLVVFHELLHVPLGGCDVFGNGCGKLTDHPVQDFPECIAAASGNLFWTEPEADGIINLLDPAGAVKLDLEASLKKAGYIKDPERCPFPTPDPSKDVDDPIGEMIKLAYEKTIKDERLEKSVGESMIDSDDVSGNVSDDVSDTSSLVEVSEIG